jgi:shikimate kinase
MTLVLVGMSGVGKSVQAAALAARGFLRHDVDAEIASRVPDLAVPLPGERPVETVGRWMGMPWAPGHFDREAAYLALEAEVTAAALARARGQREHVLDTTGSVVHLPEPLLAQLRDGATVVLLDGGPDAAPRLLSRYLAEPKPVIWGQSWAPRLGETSEAALARCYPGLLARRDHLYRALAHHVVDGRAATPELLMRLAERR